jgi:hypothetical protein
MVASCGGDRITSPVTAPSPVAAAVPGTLLVSLETADAPAGALMLLLRGRGLGVPSASDSTTRLYVRAVDSTATELRVAVIGTQLTGTLFAVSVPDVTHLEAYSVSLVEVADVSNVLRPDLAGYRLLMARQP